MTARKPEEDRLSAMQRTRGGRHGTALAGRGLPVATDDLLPMKEDVRLPTPADVVLAPVLVRLDTAVRLYGFSRSDLYRRSAAGEIVLLKCNGRTVVRVADLERLVSSLPRLHPSPDAA